MTVDYLKAQWRAVHSGAKSVAYSWSGLVAGDIGTSVSGAEIAFASFQISGELAGAAVTIEGSNNGVDYVPLLDTFNKMMLFTTPGLKQAFSTVLWVRPKVANGGSDTLVDVTAVYSTPGC